MFPADLAKFIIQSLGLVSPEAQAYAALGSLAIYFGAVIAVAGIGVAAWEKLNG